MIMASSPYVAEKNFDDLDSRWINPLGKLLLDVFVWKSETGLYQNTNFKNKKSRAYVGAYVGVPGRKASGLFGEIHLIRDRIGGGYVAHEIAHAVFDYMTAFDHVVAGDITSNEKLAKITGDTTNAFWINFYERYEPAEPRLVLANTTNFAEQRPE